MSPKFMFYFAPVFHYSAFRFANKLFVNSTEHLFIVLMMTIVRPSKELLMFIK